MYECMRNAIRAMCAYLNTFTFEIICSVTQAIMHIKLCMDEAPAIITLNLVGFQAQVPAILFPRFILSFLFIHTILYKRCVLKEKRNLKYLISNT